MTVQMSIVGRAKWQSFCKEAEPLMRQHHQEVGMNGIPFELDHQAIELMEQHGNVVFWIARDQEGVVGYIVWYLGYHLFSKGLRVAQMGPWYVDPRGRHSSIAMRLWDVAKRELKGMGVDVLLPHHQFTKGFELDVFFKRQGAIPYEMAYLLPLREIVE